MRHVLNTILYFVILSPNLLLAKESVNVLSYYAMGNTLDGQPMIDQTNVLRFYPVFSLRERTDTVRVTIYHGSNVYSRNAQPVADGKYWQALLPKFKLGEAIQRIEVEAHHKTEFGEGEKARLETSNLKIWKQLVAVAGMNMRLSRLTHELLKNKKLFIYKNMTKKEPQTISDALDEQINKLGNLQNCILNEDRTRFQEIENILPKHLEGYFQDSMGYLNNEKFVAILDSLKVVIGMLDQSGKSEDKKKEIMDVISEQTNLVGLVRPLSQSKFSELIDVRNFRDIEPLVNENIPVLTEVLKRLDLIDLYVLKIREMSGDSTQIEDIQDCVAQIEVIKKEYLEHFEAIDTIITRRDSLKFLFKESITKEMADTTSSGVSIKVADVTIDSDFAGATVLYRNYKGALRYMPALDPAERMGIFRIRYVPFPIVDNRLFRPGDGDAVFEVGLGFGDVIVAGDEFVRPQLSLRRLGIAFVITDKLFAKDAKILGVALTYDFNSYGSLGVGANFGCANEHDDTIEDCSWTKGRPYFSFGINKKAFEGVLVGLAGFFK